MLIRHLAIPLALASCLDAQAPLLGEQQDNIICSPLCGDGYQNELQGVYSYGFSLFANARSTEANCADIGSSARIWDCVVTFISSENPCGAYAVECLGQGSGKPPVCNWWNTNNCQ